MDSRDKPGSGQVAYNHSQRQAGSGQVAYKHSQRQAGSATMDQEQEWITSYMETLKIRQQSSLNSPFDASVSNGCVLA